MLSRITLLIVLATITTQSVSAQTRTHRRRGALLGGLAGAAIGVAIGDRGNNETAGALIGGAVGAIAGGTIGDAKDRQIDHNRIYHREHGQAHHWNTRPVPVSPQHAPQVHHQNFQGYSVPSQIQPPAIPQRMVQPEMLEPLTSHEVLAMVHNGLSEAMVIDQIRFRGMDRPLRVADLIGLHQQGVSEPILDAMQVSYPYTNGYPTGVPIR